MKKNVLMMISVLLIFCTFGANAQDQAVLETQNSGCLSRTRGYMDEWIPAIVLKKEGSILSVEVQNYISNCGTSDFVVNFSMSDGNNGEPCTLSAEVLPVISEEDEEDCMCPFNVSFTVRDFEVNTFFLDCGWYKGLVELKDGEPLVLKEREYYESLLSESKVWTMLYKAVVNPEVYGDVYYLKETKLVGDTIINDIPFMQKYRREWKLGEKKPAEWSATDEYLGQNGGKVYIYSNRNKNMVEDMDMSLNVGDKTTSYYYYDEDKELPFCFVATAVSDTILYNADVIKPRKCTHVLLENYPSETDIWIDGVGSVSLGIDGLGLFQADGAISKLYKVTDGDAVIYQSDNDLPVVINETNFPDAAFRKYVGYQYDKNQDGILNDEEISEAMSMFLFDGDISDVKGIEFLTALQQLYCTGAQIESLDLSKCTSLTWLECIDNHKLTTLDVSGCKALTKLSCSGGQLTSLDVSGLTALTSLDCSYNRLTSLDVSELTSLTSLNCSNNALTSLDVSMNTELQNLGCGGNQLTQIDVTQNKNLKKLSCPGNLLTELDLSQNPELEILYCWGNQLTALDVSKNTKITGINCYSNLISEAQMGAFVESLPVVEKGYLIAIDTADSNEGNVINMELAAAANAKGWFVKDQSGWYIGDDPTISNNDFRTWTEGEVSMWFTITSWENKTCKVKANHAISEQTEGHVTIPSEANGYTVTGIGQSAFHGCNKITDISIPETVTSIEADAFGGCSSLTSVIIPNSVREVGIGAFQYCSGLTSVTLSESMYEISIGLFEGCTSLTSVTIPERVSTIGGAAFEGCSSLTSVSIPDYLETIGGLAFDNCTSLASISLPSRLHLLGNGAFHNCSSLTSITIPDGVYRLDSYTFGGCSSLTSVTIGSGVGSIEDHVFSDCSVLADVYCKAESVPKTDILAFDSTDISHVTLHVPKSAKEAYQSTKPWSEFGKIVAIGETGDEVGMVTVNGIMYSVWTYGASVWHAEDMYLTSAVIEDTITIDGTKYPVTSIGDQAFYLCQNLESVKIPETVKTIGADAFAFCSKLKEIVLPDSLHGIRTRTFDNCISLESLVIPEKVSFIGNNIVNECANLKRIDIMSNVELTLIDNAFRIFSSYSEREQSHLEAINVSPDNPTLCSVDGVLYTKDMKTLIKCPEMKTGQLTVPEGVERLECYAFLNCIYLTNIDLPSSLREMGNHPDIPSYTSSPKNGVMRNCRQLTEITIPEGVTWIGDHDFSNCVSLRKVVLPQSLKVIGRDAFINDEELEDINLPENLDSLEEAFYRCNKVQPTLPRNLKYLGDSPFIFCISPTTLVIGEQLKSIGYQAFLFHKDTQQNLKQIYICQKEPLEPGENYFDYKIFGVEEYKVGRKLEERFPSFLADNCTLYVPTGSKELYQSSPIWGNFKQIEEFDYNPSWMPEELGIADCFVPSPNGADGTVYTLGGVRLKSPSKGVNIIRQSDGTTKKVIMR